MHNLLLDSLNINEAYFLCVVDTTLKSSLLVFCM